MLQRLPVDKILLALPNRKLSCASSFENSQVVFTIAIPILSPIEILKPENLLVHNSTTSVRSKIADFGLSAAFGPQSQMLVDQDTVVESLAPRGASSYSIQEDSSLTDTTVVSY
jgi:hypothetical protein